MKFLFEKLTFRAPVSFFPEQSLIDNLYNLGFRSPATRSPCRTPTIRTPRTGTPSDTATQQASESVVTTVVTCEE